MYKKAIFMDLKFPTSAGVLTITQLPGASLTQIKTALKDVRKILTKDNDDELSFLDDAKEIDVENQLRFDILKDIYMTKKKEAADARDAIEVKKHNQKIDNLIAKKKDEDLEKLSVEELEKLRK